MQTLMNAERISATIAELAERLLADSVLQPLTPATVALVGIRSRGEIIAERLAHEIRARRNLMAPVGALDITMYRDDLGTRSAITIPQGTEMNFRLDDRAVILIDDVLETGRSVRAALDAVVDFGRPRLIRLLALVERGGREYPIAADYAGTTLGADPAHRVVVHLRPTDSEDAVYLAPRPGKDGRSK